MITLHLDVHVMQLIILYIYTVFCRLVVYHCGNSCEHFVYIQLSSQQCHISQLMTEEYQAQINMHKRINSFSPMGYQFHNIINSRSRIRIRSLVNSRFFKAMFTHTDPLNESKAILCT